MDKIKTQKKQSMYEVFDIPYDDIKIDNNSIDEYLDSKFPGKNIKGLVPTTSGWLIDEKDEEIVWERIIPTTNEKTICPILICPDDQDYYCTTIVVEIENNGAKIFWKRFGINKKYTLRKYELIGKEVEWYPNVSPLEFELDEYENLIKEIKENRKTEA